MKITYFIVIIVMLGQCMFPSTTLILPGKTNLMNSLLFSIVFCRVLVDGLFLSLTLSVASGSAFNARDSLNYWPITHVVCLILCPLAEVIAYSQPERSYS